MLAGMSFPAERKLAAAIEAPMGPGMRRPDTRVIAREGWYQVVTPSAPGAVLNEIALSQVAPEEAERVIDEAIATYRAHRLPVKWCVGPWTRPEGFGEMLARRGFRGSDVRGMGIDTSARIDVPDGVHVEEIDDEVGIDGFVATAMRGWALPEEQMATERDVHAAALAASPRVTHLFAARVAGELVGTAGLFLRGDYAYLLAGQVLEHARGRGAYRALVAARLGFLHARSVDYAVTHAREATSAPMLAHLGFETLFRSKCYVLGTT
jgi:hypothetical protein